MTPDLILVPASAGSGKTFTLKELLHRGLTGAAWEIDPNKEGARVLDQPLRPDALVAVTFTEAAAAELRERIRGTLLEKGEIEAANRLDDAYLSTIHGFGLRLLREFAFDRGMALEPRLLTDDEQQLLVRKALGDSRIIESIAWDLKRYGYRYDHGKKLSAEGVFREAILGLIATLRSIGSKEDIEPVIQEAKGWLNKAYGETLNGTNEELAKPLKNAVVRLLDAYPFSITHMAGSNKSAKAAFRQNYAALKQAAETDALHHDWSLWASLGDLRIKVGHKMVEEGYVALAEDVMHSASRLNKHPGPLETAKELLEKLLISAHETMGRYGSKKKDAGLLDYSDMVAGAYDALKDPAIAEQLRSRVDCVVVDEFQDTSPIQFGLLWQLIRLGQPSVLVGDTKQSIMGFQGADPRLFDGMVNAFRSNAETLGRNWRSQEKLLDFINGVTSRLFDNYEPLGAKGADSKLTALHVITTPNESHTKRPSWRAARIAEAIRKKLEDPQYVITDRHTKQERRLRGGDCAILCPTHSMLTHYANALRDQGLKVRLKQEGWMESLEITLALQALALAHNPNDLHARLYLASTALGEHSLQDALNKVVQGEELLDPCFEPLLDMTDWASTATIDTLVPEILRRLGIYDAVTTWKEGRQARANIQRLEGLAAEFKQAQPESLVASGIYGKGIPQFLSWLAKRADSDNQMPPASTMDDDAVELVTWHACKGREWPIVAVCGLAKSFKAHVPGVHLEYPSFDNLDELIESAGIEFSPKFHSDDVTDKFKDALLPDVKDEVLRLIYVALTRPRDQLLLEWPLDAVEHKDQSRWAWLLNQKIQMTLNDQSVTLCGEDEYPAIIQHAQKEVEPGYPERPEQPAPQHGRRALEKSTYTGSLVPDSRAPSAHDEETPDSEAIQYQEIRYAEPLALPDHSNFAAVGSYVHRVFELGTDQGQVAEYLINEAESLWPGQGEEIYRLVAASKKAFDATLQETFAPTNVHAEVPLIGLDANNTVVNGIVDLLVETGDSKIIIDHKTDREADMQTILRRHVAQLEGYASLLDGDKALTGINAVMNGAIILNTTGNR